MNKFKAGDKVKVVSAERDTYWYASKIGNTYTLKSFDGEDWVVKEIDFGVFAACDLELVEDEKETTSKWLRENKWFIRTGSPEKSKLVQEWLFEHGYGWFICMNNISDFNEKYLTNTSDAEGLSKYIMHGNGYKDPTQEIILEFQTTIKSVKLPEEAKPTAQQLKIAELEQTIQIATQQIQKLKEEI